MENELASRIWKKIALFYLLTLCFSGFFDVLVLHAGKMDAGNLIYVTGSMWSPALAAFATKGNFLAKACAIFPGGGARHVTCGSVI